MTRYHAYMILNQVLFHGKHAHLLLKDLKLQPQEQAFVSALVYTTLQNYYYLEAQITDLVDKKLPKEVRLILILGAAQYFKMTGVPDYALVNESVNLTKKLGYGRYQGVVNAVLKKMMARGERTLVGSSLEVTAIQTSMPLWILNLLSKQYSEDFALAYAQYCQEIKPNYIRLNTFKPIALSDDVVKRKGDTYIAKPALFQSDLLEQGHVLVQDINSQKVVETLDIKPEMDVLDCCCGPGTKTVQIANALDNEGCIIGLELHESRAQKTRELMERCGVTCATILTQDVLTYETDQSFDRILLDAPCSGLGVLSHKHDLRYHIKPEDLDALETLQHDMLEKVSPYLKVDGILVYATCTLNRKENDKQVATFLQHHDNFKLLSEITTNPMETQGDGFYIAKIQRTW